MALKFKPYDPVQHQQQAKKRQQKRMVGRSTLAPTSTTCVGSLPPQSLVAGHICSRADEELFPSTNTDKTQNPYYGYPSPEDWLELCSAKDATVSSAYTTTSGNPLSYTDSVIDIQDASLDSSCQEDSYKDDELSQTLLAAIATMPSTSELKIGESAFNMNVSGFPAPTRVSQEQSNTGISPVEQALSSDAKSIASTVSSIGTPATGTSPIHQERASSWRNQDSFIDNKYGAQDSSARMPDLGRFNVTSKDALSGEGSIMEPSITELSSTKKIPVQDAVSSSTKRSFSESGATNDSQPSSSDVCHSSKRLRLTSTSSEEAVSTLLNIQKMISNLLAKLCQGQPHSLIPDVNVRSKADTIEVAGDEVGDSSSDDNSGIGSGLDDSDSDTEPTTSKPRGFQHRSTQRRRWTEKEEKLLWTLKGTQKRNGGKPSDCQIANRLGRTESGVKQHWDIMSQKKHR